MRRRGQNRRSWNPGADAAAESQLLSGLVTFRRRAAGQADGFGNPGPFNTPAATLDLDFARQLQSLRLMNSASLGEEDSEFDRATADANANKAADGLVDISTDLLVMAADGQLEQSLRWQQRQRQLEQKQLLEQQRQHLTLSLPLLGGRLNYFLQASNSPAPTNSPPLAPPFRASKQQGRLAYRTSPSAVGASPDAEIALLLRSRTPTQTQIRQRLSASPEDASKLTQMSTSPPLTMPKSGPAVSKNPCPVSSASTGDVKENGIGDASLLSVRGEIAVSVDARTVNIEREQSNDQSTSQATNPNEDFSIREQHQKRLLPKKSQKNQRRKVTGLEMLNNIDAKPQPQQPSTLTPSPTSPIPKLTMKTPKTESQSPTIPATTVISRRKRIIRPLPIESYIDRDSDHKDQRSNSDVSRSCTCLSHADHEQLLGRGSRHPSSSVLATDDHQKRRLTQQEKDEQSQSPLSHPPQHEHKEVHDDQLEPKQRSVVSIIDSSKFRLQKRPKPDQYRTAHCQAQSANQNAQFFAWLREGRDPAGFFSSRTNASGYYSYFNRLPRYDRGLQPFADFPPPERTAPQHQCANKKGATTPAFLAYGGKNPDNYLPPPILVRVRQQKEKLAKSADIAEGENLETTRQ